MRYKVLEACISNVAINAVSSINGSPQVAYDAGSSICGSSEVAYVIKAGLHAAEKAMRSLRNCQTFARTPHLWRRNIGSAYRLENRGEVTDVCIRNELKRKGNYKPKHPLSYGEDISEVNPEVVPEVCIFPIVFQLGDKGNNNNKTKQVEIIEKVVEIDPEVLEVYFGDIDQESASLPPSGRINDLGDFCPPVGKVKKTLVSQCGPNVQNALYGIDNKDDRYQTLSHPGHDLER
jgi:hypothetical protein